MGWKRKRLEAMDDEDVNDVHLVGTDGEEVPCCKATLAMMSPVFKGMFFRGFKEQKMDRCNLNFHSVVITLLVKYCYCGELDTDLIFGNSRSLQEEVSLMVDLREAGRYFDIEDLISYAEVEIGNLVFRKAECNDKMNYQYASAFLTELFKRNENGRKCKSLWVALSLFALANMMECFGPTAPVNSSTHVHPGVLLWLLGHERVIDIYKAVMCIQTWFFVESKGAVNGYSDEEKRDLIEFANNIDLKLLSTEQLSEIKPSQLFASERILEAFVHHCKRRQVVTRTPPPQRMNLFILGAEMKILNGLYLPKGPITSGMYYREVQYNGRSCYSIIYRKNAAMKWFISIAKKKMVEFSSDNEVSESCIQLHLYESSGNSMEPPGSGWKRFEGNEPVPIFGCICNFVSLKREQTPNQTKSN